MRLLAALLLAPLALAGQAAAPAPQYAPDGAYMDPEFMNPFEDKGQRVTIREGDKPEIQLNAIPR
jgi:hypothetical protein